MIEVTLIDNSIKIFNVNQISPLDIAQSISPSLAKNSLYAVVDGINCDLNYLLTKNVKIQFITNKDEEHALQFIRHDLAHVLAESVTELYPEVKLGVGPATENGFFYDFLTDYTFSTDDLLAIENNMRKIIDRNEIIVRKELSKKEAYELFKQKEELLKLTLLEKINDEEIISIYSQGNFLDLCRGPHSLNTSKISKSFKLTKVSSVYWQGDSNSHSLQRIYGNAFLTSKELINHQQLEEEAQKRDHRKLGKDLSLFHMQSEAVGSVFWQPKGWTLYLLLESYIRKKLLDHNYQEVKTPQILSRSLWEKSGHWEKFKDDIFIVSSDKEELAIKPMNCPAHIEVFKQGIKSYKDLPFRLSEFGSCFRNEPSGALNGLLRVRAFTQDDAHIFCTQDQIVSETNNFIKLLLEVYEDLLGKVETVIKFSDRPKIRSGTDEEWDLAESKLLSAAKASGVEVINNPGEGAFYGPKLEFSLKDSLGRTWQLGTLQLDYILPKRLNAKYIGEDGKYHTPVLLHRAILGSFERFIAIMIEHYEGKFPFWLAPTQIVISSITSDVDNFATKVHEKLLSLGIRSALDLRNEKINYKIREHSLMKVPLIAIIGQKEVENNQITIREFGSNQNSTLDLIKAFDFIKDLNTINHS